MMDRRQFLATGIAGGAIALLPAPALAALPEAARRFDVTTEVDIAALGPEAAHLWLPVFQDDRACQRDLGATFETNGKARLVRDSATGARMLHAQWQPGQTDRRIVVTQHLATWERVSQRGTLGTSDRARYTRATALVPTDGLAASTARTIVGERRDPRAQVRALYDWMVANTWRDPATPGCGPGNVTAMLRDQRFAGKCVDLSRLFVSFARSLGIPAREVYGLRLAPSALFKSLGRGPDVTGAQHCRAEVWLEDAPGRGAWFALDPADVRKAVLEEKLTADSEPIKALTERLFGRWENNWAGYNSAEALTLPGAPLSAEYDFLMYPAAMTGKLVCKCLDAKAFAYRITSREAVG